MTDLDTLSSERDGVPDGAASGTHARSVRRVRGLPRGRAVVGALLVVASAVAVFAAYLDARREPSVSYLVADDALEPGTRFADRDEVLAAVSSAPIDLVPEVAARAIPIEDVDLLVGWTVVAPLERGDLVLRSAVVPDGEVDDAHTLSFSLPRAAAVGGSLRPGEHLDVLATYGSGDRATTTYVVRGVPLLQVSAQDGGALGGSGEVILTVAVPAPEDVQALGHAVNTATVFVARATTSESDLPGAPADYRFLTGGDVGAAEGRDADASPAPSDVDDEGAADGGTDGGAEPAP